MIATIPVLLYRIPFLTHLFVHQEPLSEWIYRALIFLVIACPCALVISIPLGFFGGIGGASKRGILVKGSNFLEALANIRTLVFDKTGTLTEGVFKVTEIVSVSELSKEQILEYGAAAEMYSNHPVAKSILEAYGRKFNPNRVKDYTEITGYGIKAKIDEKVILAGNDRLLHKENIHHEICKTDETIVHTVVDGKYAGYIVVSDKIRRNAHKATQKLRADGISRQIMLTGDSKEIAQSVSEKLRLDGFFAELLPQEKVQKMEELVKNKTSKNEKVAFVGDGINDAPVLARSDIGIAMGALGSDAAIEAADVVLMTDDLMKIHEGIHIAKKTRHIVWQNIILSLGVKTIFLGLGAFGIATMWEAVFADVGVAILAILNASRAIYSPLKNSLA